MIEIKNVTKSYVKNKKTIDNLNLQIKDGEIFGFLGPNGAGKSTSIKMMTGILFPDKGNIDILGLNPVKNRKKLAYEIKKNSEGIYVLINFEAAPTFPSLLIKFENFWINSLTPASSTFGLIMNTVSYLFIIFHLPFGY